MISTVALNELRRLLSAEHNEPHHILGMHEIKRKKTRLIAVRVFIPQAKRVVVIDDADGTNYELHKIHIDGFYEAVINRDKWFKYQLDITFHNDDHLKTYDPYSFAPSISELDRYLFGEGTHYEIYDKLGAHTMTLDGVDGVSFTVWAPNAARVSVIGSFNSWDGRRHQMRTLGSSGIWEIFIPGLKNRDKYKFELRSQNGLVFEKTDPFGSFFELRPSTATFIHDRTYQWSDDEWIACRNRENPLKHAMNIYEVHLGSWLYNHSENRFYSYSELADRLIPYVKSMHYTHIEIMGISEHPFDGSWGYQVTGYYAPTSRYGSPDEFMAFIDRAHHEGIGVILDWVPAHFPKDTHGLSNFDGTALYEHLDSRQGEHPDWGTLIFNFGRKEVKNFLIGSALMWIEKYHIDGLRVDAVASMIYLDYGKEPGQWVPNQYGGKENLDAIEFLRHMNSVILGRYSHILMIAEESTAWGGVSRPPETGGLGFNLKWNMGWMNDFLSYISKDPIYKKYHHNQLTFSMVYAYTENFVLIVSHDEVVHGKCSFISKMPGDLWQKFANLRAALGFMYGHPGKKLLFMGSEFGQFVEWSESRELDWFLLEYPHHAQTHEFVKDLNLFYKSDRPCWYNDFSGGGFEWIDCNDAERSMLSFIRRGKTNKEITIFAYNFTPVVYENHRLSVPFKADYREVMNSDDPKYGGSGVINTGALIAEDSHGGYSIGLRMPPLGMVIIKPVI